MHGKTKTGSCNRGKGIGDTVGASQVCNLSLSVKAEEIFKEVMADNFLKLMKDIKLQIQEAPKSPSRKTERNSHLRTSIKK